MQSYRRRPGTWRSGRVWSRQKAWLEATARRPVWQRTGRIAEIIGADLFLTLYIMLVIVIVHYFSRKAGFEDFDLVRGLTIGHIFTYFHAVNFHVNGVSAVWHLIQAHLSGHP